ncbi:asparaginase [Alkaliphilus peptidifermentans]|uniref:asparaginase n=1 Tax=Alkaliphilus peptidifermentans DSM 18978 TaxID=1120976 RepID=A0A1G5CFR8_9FIRM|nr:asparaginase [Alkaliphilus peptidifermentans]SCY01263.1 asparaginase [Alkaliphilus peptidifermentans DSM 18978]
MDKPKVAVIFTGGTISMSIDPRIGAAIPSLSNQEILSLVTNIDKYASIETINFSTLPGPHIDPLLMMDLRSLVMDTLQREDIDGVVITHGTDTLEETAFLLDLTIDSNKSVVIAGAMRNSSELGYDGPSNLAAAVCTAISPQTKGKGVLVVMNNEVNAASEVTKTNTLSLDTFKSLEFGPLGIVDNDEVILHRDIVSRQHIYTDSIIPNVDLVKCVAGMDSRLLKFCVDSGSKGIILEAMGRGNVPPGMIDGITYAINNDVAVVMVSRCPTGRVLDTYGYEGGGRSLRNLGVILGGDLPGQKARIKLMLALAVTQSLNEVKQIMEHNQYGPK